MSEVQSDSTNDSQLIQECQMDREPFFIDWLNEREMSEKLLPVKMMIYKENWVGVSECSKHKWLTHATMGPNRSTIEYLGEDKIRWRVRKTYFMESDNQFEAMAVRELEVRGIGNVLQKIRSENDC